MSAQHPTLILLALFFTALFPQDSRAVDPCPQEEIACFYKVRSNLRIYLQSIEATTSINQVPVNKVCIIQLKNDPQTKQPSVPVTQEFLNTQCKILVGNESGTAVVYSPAFPDGAAACVNAHQTNNKKWAYDKDLNVCRLIQ